MEEKTKKNIKQILDSKIPVRVLYGIGIVIATMLIFSAGITVGFYKASYGRAWGEHYNENFGIGDGDNGPVNGIINKMGVTGYFPNSHGATGKIIKLEIPNLIVQDKDKIEKVIVTDEDTKIQEGREDVKTADLKVNDSVTVIGAPNGQGQIEAKLIRVIPAPEFLK